MINENLDASGTSGESWYQKEVDLASLKVRSLPLEWEAMTKLGRGINDAKEDPLSRDDLFNLTPSPEIYSGLPMVASIVAHERNPFIPIIRPTETQVKAFRPWLGVVSSTIGRFSTNWQARFDRYLERKGTEIVDSIGKNVITVLDIIEQIGSNHPKQKFVTELGNLYVDLAKPEMEQGGFLGLDEVERSIESKVAEVIEDAYIVRDGGYGIRFTRKKYPFLSGLLRVSHMPPDGLGLMSDFAPVVGAEIMEGVERFLRKENIRNLPSAPRQKGFDLFDPGTYVRTVSEWFASEKLDRVKDSLPERLRDVRNCIPEDGPALVQRIYDIAEGVVILKKQGTTEKELIDALLRK